ncbi:DUF6415 family natural product biosynthesis protein [Streptomyces sp. Tue6028]|uniref:DUF6415 family natural product biosynthesis protein n=1 Tax=Streptomyces sp. Tue6028 TaxID=2036037 RepID=UPI003D718BBA
MTRSVAPEDAAPVVDITDMRQAVASILPEDGQVGTEALARLTAQLRAYMEVLAPEVEMAAGRLPHDDVPRYCALACVGEARGKLRALPGKGPGRDQAYARKLARSLAALCDHYATLTGEVMCVACDREIHRFTDAVPYDQVSNSAGALTGRVHSACVNTPRPSR